MLVSEKLTLGFKEGLHSDKIARATPIVQSLKVTRKKPPMTRMPQIAILARIRAGRSRAWTAAAPSQRIAT
jgi:hypothetical protein